MSLLALIAGGDRQEPEKAPNTADRRGYWRSLEPSLVRTELADRDCAPDRQPAL